MILQSIEKVIATSRIYFSLPIAALAKPESSPRRDNQVRAGWQQKKSARNPVYRLPSDRSGWVW